MFGDIKFRAKRTDNEKPGVWTYGDLAHTIKITVDKDIPVIRVGGCDIDEKTIGQYVGIKDENDKEIYNGDIIDCCYFYEEYSTNGGATETNCSCKGVVVYDTDFLAWVVEIIEADGILRDYDNANLGGFDLETIHVIGNIYDNSDMLTEELRRKFL